MCKYVATTLCEQTKEAQIKPDEEINSPWVSCGGDGGEID